MLLAFLLLGAATAQAQIEPINQRAANRRALRDARKSKAPYKDSHLTVSKATLRRGSASRSEPRDGREAYKFDNTGTARVSEPSKPTLRFRKKKREATALPGN